MRHVLRPLGVAFSRFKNHKLVPHEKDLDPVVSAVVEDIAGKIEELRNVGVVPADAPSLGEILAIDATDIPAYANPNRDVPADPNAVWGYRTPKNKSPKSQTGQKEYFYGYDADVIVDAYHRMPLYLNTRPANWNEGPRMRDDVNALQSLHPWMKPRCLTADKGYHALYNFRYLTDRSILPIIAIPRPQKNPKTGRRLHEGLYNEKRLAHLHRGQSHGLRGDRGRWSPPLPLSRGRLSPEEQNGLVQVLRLRLF